MRAKLLQSLTRSELVSLANFDARYPKATQATRERYVICARQRMARERANAIDWNGVPTRDCGDPELHEELEGVAFCGSRGAWAYGRWADEPEVFTAAGIATTRSRCDLEGDLEEAISFENLVDQFEEQCEVQDTQDFLDQLEDAALGLEDLPYEDLLIACDGSSFGWRMIDHGPIGGPKAYEKWMDEVLWTETVSIGSWKTMDVDFTRREHIGRQPGTTDEALDRWFWNKMDALRRINPGIAMPQVVILPRLRGGERRMTFVEAEDYHARRKAREEEKLRREMPMIQAGPDHEFEAVGDDPEPVLPKPHNGRGHQAKVAVDPIAVPSNPAFAPEFDESEYADLS